MASGQGDFFGWERSSFRGVRRLSPPRATAAVGGGGQDDVGGERGTTHRVDVTEAMQCGGADDDVWDT